MRQAAQPVDSINLIAQSTESTEFPQIHNIHKQLREAEAAKILNVSCDWLRRQRMKKQGPPYRRFGGAVRYDVDELREWMAAQSTMRTIQNDK
jgi:predicted DNA-binding transcriptional regulator AlpA